MSSLINKDYIYTNVRVDNIFELVEYMTKKMVADGVVTSEYKQKVLEREEIYPTGLPTEPYGIAIPHCDPDFVNENTISVATLKEPIEFNVMGSDKEKIDVYIVFLLALKESNKQLNILSSLMEYFRNQETISNIYKGNKDEIYQILKLN